MRWYNQTIFNGVEEESVAENHQRSGVWCEPSGFDALVVASEPGGRNLREVEPLRDCCVNAYGLFDPEWQFNCNLSGTAGV